MGYAERATCVDAIATGRVGIVAGERALGYAFVTTPQGDLNLDGTLDDNSMKVLSQYGNTTRGVREIKFCDGGLVEDEAGWGWCHDLP